MPFKKYCYQKNKKCIDCNKIISDWAIRCQKCNNRTYKFVWTKEQERLLIENYPKMESKELSKIINKTPKQIDYKIRKQFQFLKKHKPQKTLFCENCKKEFKRYTSQILISGGMPKKLNFCSIKCKSEWMSEAYSGENNPTWKGGYFPYFGRNWQKVRRKIREERILECQRCGIPEIKLNEELHLHHITPRRFFQKVEDSNYSTNLLLLCSKCHKEVENGDMPEVWKAETIAKLFERNVSSLQTSKSIDANYRHNYQESMK